MAAIEASDSNGQKKQEKVRAKKMSTKIDFTPMVDLGFLLITFFMLTTTLAKPTVMPVIIPERNEPKDLQDVKASQVLTLLLGADDKVYYYQGIEHVRLDSTNYAADGLRRVILDNKARVKGLFGEEERDDPKRPGLRKQVSKLYVLIKPTRSARYKNLVDALDEMKITEVARYILLDVSPEELDFIKNPSAGLSFSATAQAAAAVGTR